MLFCSYDVEQIGFMARRIERTIGLMRDQQEEEEKKRVEEAKRAKNKKSKGNIVNSDVEMAEELSEFEFT